MSALSKSKGGSSLFSRVATAPVSWGVCEVPGWGIQLPAERVLSEMSQIGFGATELGSQGYFPREACELNQLFKRHSMNPLAAFVPVVIHEPGEADRAISLAGEIADHLVATGAQYFNTAAITSWGWDARSELSDDHWDHLFSMIEALERTCEAQHLNQVFHPHFGTVVETADEVERLLDGSSVHFVLDSAHLAIGGVDPVAFANDYTDRVGLVHLKDVDLAAIPSLKSGAVSLMEAVKNGIFRPLGQGGLQIGELVETLESNGYCGWYVIEQDTAIAAGEGNEAFEAASTPMTDVRASVDYFAELEVVRAWN